MQKNPLVPQSISPLVPRSLVPVSKRYLIGSGGTLIRKHLVCPPGNSLRLGKPFGAKQMSFFSHFFHKSDFQSCDGKLMINIKIPWRVPRSIPRGFIINLVEKINNFWTTRSILNHVVTLDSAHQDLKLFLLFKRPILDLKVLLNILNKKVILFDLWKSSYCLLALTFQNQYLLIWNVLI